MSLINDALKRASQTEPPAPPPIDTMQPVMYAPGGKWPLVVLPVVLVAVLASAGWFFMKSWQTARQLALSSSPAVAARELTPPSSPGASGAPTPSRPSTPPPAVADQEPPPAQPAPATPEPAPTAPPPIVDLPPTFPALKLQGVFYHEQNPSVVINTKLLRVGDKIDKARIVSISREGAVVEWQGETRELMLP